MRSCSCKFIYLFLKSKSIAEIHTVIIKHFYVYFNEIIIIITITVTGNVPADHFSYDCQNATSRKHRICIIPNPQISSQNDSRGYSKDCSICHALHRPIKKFELHLYSKRQRPLEKQHENTPFPRNPSSKGTQGE
jgi:hypothetical protein